MSREVLNPITIAVLGTGAWGQTLADLASQNGHQVRSWSRRGTQGLEAVVEGAEMILSAVSVAGVRSLAEQLQALSLPKTIFVTATKGLDTLTSHTPSQIWQDAFPDAPVVVLSGPNLAKEIQQGLPAATVVAGREAIATQTVQYAFSRRNFRVYTNADPLGVELGGTLKNVMAIASGTCDGLQLGTNAKAALLTRGLAEMIRIGSYWGAKPETFYGLSGLGDLLATCNSNLSRNYQVGYQLAHGKALPAILAELEGTAEGVNTTAVLIKLALKEGLDVPIAYQVHRLLQGEVTPQQAVEALMLRDNKPE